MLIRMFADEELRKFLIAATLYLFLVVFIWGMLVYLAVKKSWRKLAGLSIIAILMLISSPIYLNFATRTFINMRIQYHYNLDIQPLKELKFTNEIISLKPIYSSNNKSNFFEFSNRPFENELNYSKITGWDYTIDGLKEVSECKITYKSIFSVEIMLYENSLKAEKAYIGNLNAFNARKDVQISDATNENKYFLTYLIRNRADPEGLYELMEPNAYCGFQIKNIVVIFSEDLRKNINNDYRRKSIEELAEIIRSLDN